MARSAGRAYDQGHRYDREDGLEDSGLVQFCAIPQGKQSVNP